MAMIERDSNDNIWEAIDSLRHTWKRIKGIEQRELWVSKPLTLFTWVGRRGRCYSRQCSGAVGVPQRGTVVL